MSVILYYFEVCYKMNVCVEFVVSIKFWFITPKLTALDLATLHLGLGQDGKRTMLSLLQGW